MSYLLLEIALPSKWQYCYLPSFEACCCVHWIIVLLWRNISAKSSRFGDDLLVQLFASWLGDHHETDATAFFLTKIVMYGILTLVPIFEGHRSRIEPPPNRFGCKRPYSHQLRGEFCVVIDGCLRGKKYWYLAVPGLGRSERAALTETCWKGKASVGDWWNRSSRSRQISGCAEDCTYKYFCWNICKRCTL